MKEHRLMRKKGDREVFQYIQYKNQSYDTTGQYYADVDYVDKEIAKKQGALWDWNKKLWCFRTREARHEWDIKHSSYIKYAKENKSHKHIALLDIDYWGVAYRKILEDKITPIVTISVIVLDLDNYNIVRLCNYHIGHRGEVVGSKKITKDFTIICSRVEAIEDIKTVLSEFNIKEIATFEGNHIQRDLPELNEYVWYDIKPYLCNRLNKPTKSSFYQIFGYSRRNHISLLAMQRLQKIVSAIKKEKPTTIEFTKIKNRDVAYSSKLATIVSNYDELLLALKKHFGVDSIYIGDTNHKIHNQLKEMGLENIVDKQGNGRIFFTIYYNNNKGVLLSLLIALIIKEHRAYQIKYAITEDTGISVDI